MRIAIIAEVAQSATSLTISVGMKWPIAQWFLDSLISSPISDTALDVGCSEIRLGIQITTVCQHSDDVRSHQ